MTWLEIFSSVLAVIAVVISAGSLRVSRKAHKLSEMQALPRIIFVRSWSSQGERGLYIKLETMSDETGANRLGSRDRRVLRTEDSWPVGKQRSLVWRRSRVRYVPDGRPVGALRSPVDFPVASGTVARDHRRSGGHVPGVSVSEW